MKARSISERKMKGGKKTHTMRLYCKCYVDYKSYSFYDNSLLVKRDE